MKDLVFSYFKKAESNKLTFDSDTQIDNCCCLSMVSLSFLYHISALVRVIVATKEKEIVRYGDKTFSPSKLNR